MAITGRQIRAARALLDMSQEELAKLTGLTPQGLRKIEDESVHPREGTLSDILKAFDDKGVEFTENQGVRFKANDIEIFQGADRFDDFYDFLYQHLKRCGGDVCVSVTDERELSKYRKDPELHRRHMRELVGGGRVTFRILATEGKFSSTYAQYKWQPPQSTSPTSFYAFGDCLALISFAHEPAPYVALHKAGPFAEAYRAAFNIAWKNAKEPPRQGGEK